MKLTGASEVTLWGSGTAVREFMYVDDFADAAVFLMEHYSDEISINIGSREEVSILELAKLIAGVIGWKGSFLLEQVTARWDAWKMPRLSPAECSLLAFTHNHRRWYPPNLRVVL